MKKSLFVVAALGLLASAGASADPMAIAQKSGCLACHTVDKKLVGPSYKDVAAKYKGQGDAVATLSAKVRSGGKGVWGPIPMPPNAPEKINDGDLKAVVEWILKS